MDLVFIVIEIIKDDFYFNQVIYLNNYYYKKSIKKERRFFTWDEDVDIVGIIEDIFYDLI